MNKKRIVTVVVILFLLCTHAAVYVGGWFNGHVRMGRALALYPVPALTTAHHSLRDGHHAAALKQLESNILHSVGNFEATKHDGWRSFRMATDTAQKVDRYSADILLGASRAIEAAKNPESSTSG